MSLTLTNIIHGFLVRFDDEGNLQGAAVEYREVKSVDGEIVAQKILDPRPVALNDSAKLTEIGAAINAAALADNAAKDAALQDANTAKASAEAERDAARQQVTALEAQLAALQPVIDGVPQIISFRQAKTFMQLYPVGQSDLWTVANAAADAITDPVQRVKTQNLLRDSTEYERQKQELVAFAAQLGIDAAGLDAMFVAAKAL
jgi:hypothetical protein